MQATDPSQPELTIREIQRRYFPSVSIHRLKYAVEEYGIEPRRRAGIIRLWSADQISQIESTLQRISQRRGACHV